MSSIAFGESRSWTVAPAAATEIASGADFMHSLNSGLIIHRVGQVNYDFLDEARAFALQLTSYMNAAMLGDATTFLYEEILGTAGRMHWLLHMRSPSDYARLLNMVDHDAAFRKIYEDDRLPERGGGNWERIFRQGSFRENVMLPQHGLGHEERDDEPADDRSFVPPARHQIPLPAEKLVNSGTAGLVILRTAHARYHCRDVARLYLYEWGRYINKALDGSVTIALFEEIWGSQDRLHLMMHLRSLDDYGLLRRLELEDDGLRKLTCEPRMTISGDPVRWGSLFEAETMGDAVLLPMSSVSLH